MIDTEALYADACRTPSDINQHIPTLRRYAEACQHVTEFGVRGGVSTRGLLAAAPQVYRGYDLQPAPPMLRDMAEAVGVDYHHTAGDVLAVDIDPTDLLFIDTLHNEQQLAAELAKHAHKARRFILLHDTHTFGRRDETGTGGGLWAALRPWLATNDGWQVVADYKHNNGLTVLAREAVPCHT